MKAAPLFGLVSGSFVAAWAVLHSLQPEDKVSTVRGLCLMALGFVFFVSSFDLCNYIMFHTIRGKKMIEKYKLTLYDVMDISNKLVSAMQAVLSSISGTIVCTFSCPRNMLRTSHFMSQAYAWFGASYFLYDIYSMFMIHNLSPKTIERLRKLCNLTKGECVQTVTQPSQLSKVKDFVFNQPVIILHHLFIGLYGFLVVVVLQAFLILSTQSLSALPFRGFHKFCPGHAMYDLTSWFYEFLAISLYGRCFHWLRAFSNIPFHLRKSFGDCVFGFIFLMELSTPLVSFRGILSRLQLKQSRIYVINGIIMIIIFFICRIFLFLFLFQYYSRFIETSVLQAVLTLPHICQVSLLILILPQIYWFTLMSKGAIGLFSKYLTKSNVATGKTSNHSVISENEKRCLSCNDDHSTYKNENNVR